MDINKIMCMAFMKSQLAVFIGMARQPELCQITILNTIRGIAEKSNPDLELYFEISDFAKSMLEDFERMIKTSETAEESNKLMANQILTNILESDKSLNKLDVIKQCRSDFILHYMRTYPLKVDEFGNATDINFDEE